MSRLYLHHWVNGPGQWERNGDVALTVREMACAASHLHSAAGFPFNRVPGAWTVGP